MTFNAGSGKPRRVITSFRGAASKRSRTEIDAERHRNAKRKLADLNNPDKRKK